MSTIGAHFKSMTADEVKLAATGRWIEILTALTAIPAEILDGKHHPCPRCGGTDRFRLIDRDKGALFCNQCFSKNNGDGLAAIRWLCGCDFPTAIAEVSNFLGLAPNGNGAAKRTKTKEVFPTAAEAVKRLESELGKRFAEWTYTNILGEPVGLVVRWNKPDGSKDFRPVSRNGKGWVVGAMPEPRPLYRLPDLAHAPTVYICEGEKAVEAARSIGLVATTSPGGCKASHLAAWNPIAGREVNILPDHDDCGWKYAGDVGTILRSLNPPAMVKLVELPGLPEAGDLVDWLDQGHTVEELRTLAEATPEWMPAATATITTTSEAFPLTDTGNAERFALQHGDVVRYCFTWAKWLVWDGIRWKIDDGGMVDQLGKQTVRNILREAADEADDARRKALAAFAKSSESVARRDAMLKLARSEPPIPVAPDALDRDVWILNCPNGRIDLRTGTLCEHRREDFITKFCPVAYQPDALCPIWLATLDTCFNHDYELIDFFQRFVGYCLTGDVTEQVLVICYGIGANGKSTIVNTMLEMLGPDYSMKATANLLLLKRDSDHPTALTDLHGKRLVACIETDDGRRLAESLVKELTGGDPIRARRMREDFWQFMPTHKVVLACNHRPIVRGTDVAIWRRLKLVPFNVVIPPDQRDKQLPGKLRAELPGILAWAVRGCLDWQCYGLGEPKAVIDATADYQNAEDVLSNFIGECCFVAPEVQVRASDLLDAYRDWSGDKRATAKRLAASLTERGVKRRTSNGVWYLGLDLLTTD